MKKVFKNIYWLIAGFLKYLYIQTMSVRLLLYYIIILTMLKNGIARLQVPGDLFDILNTLPTIADDQLLDK